MSTMTIQIDPNYGPVKGSTVKIKIDLKGVDAETLRFCTVTFGDDAASITAVDYDHKKPDTGTITVTSPSKSSPGKVTVTVTTPSGRNSATGDFTYQGDQVGSPKTESPKTDQTKLGSAGALRREDAVRSSGKTSRPAQKKQRGKT
jgi:hypothetical protein